MIKKEKILAHTIHNAILHDGKAQVGAVLPKLFQEGLKKTDIKKILPDIKKIVDEVNSWDLKKQEIEFKKYEKLFPKKEEKHELPELQNVKGKVIMRFAPFPSGALHIGNARTLILNDTYVKKYKGDLLLVIDDTIGSEEKQISKESYKLIQDSLDWLQIKYKKPVIFKSDRLKLFYKYAEELIKKGHAYICFCKQLEVKKNREEGIECVCRKKDPKIDLEHWKDMLNGKYKQGEVTLRIKTDMKDPDPAFRDRILFRISDRKHPKVKDKVWPSLEMSWAIDDHLLGITHVLRGKELKIESRVEEFIWKIFKWKPVNLLHTGTLYLEGAKISKSKSRKEVSSGKYTGWDDPRTWSLQSLERRGIQPEALRKFLLTFGTSEQDAQAPLDILYKENRRIIEKGNRYFFVKDPVKIKIPKAPHFRVEVPLHPDHLERGMRTFETKGEFYITKEDKTNKNTRLMHAFNFKGSEYLDKDVNEKLNAKMIHWLPISKDLVKVEVLMEDGSIKKGLGESGIKNLKKGDICQMERFGFCKLDKIEKNIYKFWFTHR
ncbi:MAG: glutamate--tRNA ligase [archaeon]